MVSALQRLKNALGYATFSDDSVEKAALALIEKLDNELTEAGYDAGADVDEADTDLDTAMNEADAKVDEDPEGEVDVLDEDFGLPTRDEGDEFKTDEGDEDELK